MLFSVITLILLSVNNACGNQWANTSFITVNSCLSSSVTLNCSVSHSSCSDTVWTVYPANVTVNSSAVMCNNSISSIVYTMNNTVDENVFFLVNNGSTNFPICNISLSTDWDAFKNATNAFTNATSAFTSATDACTNAMQSHVNDQLIRNITAESLGDLVMTDRFSVAGTSSNTVHNVETCITNINYANCSLESNCFAWYLNGIKIDSGSDNFIVEEAGSLSFTNASTGKAGLYYCVVTLPGNLGSFITTAKRLMLKVEETQDDNSIPAWAIVLIVLISSVAIGTLIIVAGIWLQVKVGFWCCYTQYIQRQKMIRSRTMEAINNKTDYFNSSDQLLLEPNSSKPLGIRRRSSKRSSRSSKKRFSQLRDQWECEYNCILFEKLIHQGTFKSVECATIGTHVVAVKKLTNKESELGLEELKHEASIQKHIAKISNYFEHPNVLGLYGACTMDPTSPYCLILEYMEYGTLDKLLLSLRSGPLPDWYITYLKLCAVSSQNYADFVAADLMEIIQQIISAMIFLNRHGIIHRDLSTRNVFIGEHLLVKVGNFGMTHEGHYYVVTERGHYLQDMAPECMDENKFSVKSDVWSFGIMLYKICSLENNPYPYIAPKDLCKALEEGARAKMPSSSTEELYFLMQRCWKLAPIDRPTFTTLQKCFGDYKYVSSNCISFKLEGHHSDSECSSDLEEVYLYNPPTNVLELFERTKSVREKDRNDLGRVKDRKNDLNAQYHWSNDELFNTADIELHTDQMSSEDDLDGFAQEVQQRYIPKPRDRRQKRVLSVPAMIPNGIFSDSVFTSGAPQQQRRSMVDNTDGLDKEKKAPSSSSASKLFMSDHLEPAYKEIMILSQSESSLDTDIVTESDTLHQKHKQGGYRYAYP